MCDITNEPVAAQERYNGLNGGTFSVHGLPFAWVCGKHHCD